MIVMLKAGRRFLHLETGPTFEGKKVSACLGEVACFLGNLVGTLAIATMGRLEWNWRIHHHPYQRGQRTLISFQLKPKVPMFIRHNNRWWRRSLLEFIRGSTKCAFLSLFHGPPQKASSLTQLFWRSPMCWTNMPAKSPLSSFSASHEVVTGVVPLHYVVLQFSLSPPPSPFPCLTVLGYTILKQFMSIFGLGCLLLLSCMSCLYILEIKPLLVSPFVNIYFCPVGCLFAFFMVSLAVQQLVSLIRSHLFIFVLIFIAWGDWPKKTLVWFMSENVLLIFSSSFMVSCLMCKSLSHLGFIFLYGERMCSKFIDLHAA